MQDSGRKTENAQDRDIRTVNREDLKDIREISIDEHLGDEEKRREFIRQIGDPCLYRQGEYIVSLKFADTDVTLEDRLKEYLEYVAEGEDGW